MQPQLNGKFVRRITLLQAHFIKASLTLLLASIFVNSANSRGTGTREVCPDSSSVHVDSDCTYAGHYETGSPYNFLTVVPSGRGETFADAGISLSICLKDCDGQPIVGVPAEEIVLTHPALCLCAGGNIADGPTDVNGCTTFTGTIRAAGVASFLAVVASGVEIGTVPVGVNGPVQFEFPPYCSMSSHSRAVFGANFRSEGPSAIASDLNEDGFVDLVDLAIFTRFYRDGCAQVPVPSAPRPTHRAVHDPRRSPKVPEIGVFFDSLGVTNCARLQAGESVEYWVLAFLDGTGLNGITAAEFRVQGLPTDVFDIERPVADFGFGRLNGGKHLGWTNCKTGNHGVVVLDHGLLYARSDVPSTTISVEAATDPSNRHFECPLVTKCDVPTTCDPAPESSKNCATGLFAHLNPTDPGDCTVGVQTRTWGQVKRLFR